MILIPIIAGISLATATIIEKVILSKEKTSVKFYETAGFLAIVLVMIPFLFFFWKLKPEAYTLKNVLIFLTVIIFSVIANYFSLLAMKKEKVSKLEPAKITEPLFIILLAIVFSFLFDSSLYERNTKVIIPSIIAALALIFSHVKRHHLKFEKAFMFALIASFFFALELVISRLILDYYSGITFYFLRCAFIFLITFFIFQPDLLKRKPSKLTFHIFLVAAIWVVYRVVLYYGYVKIGVISTTLLVMIGPIFIYLFAWKFLKEKITWKNIVSTIIVLACVIYVSLI